MNLYDLRVGLCRKLGYSDTPAVEVVTRLTGFLNEIHRRMLGLPGMEHLRQSQLTVASVASTPQISLPTSVARIIAIRDASSQIVLRGQSWAWYVEHQPDPTTLTGTPEYWAPFGQAAVATQPSAAARIYAKSTSASDLSTCFIEGMRSTGYPFSDSVALTGTTGVQIGSYADITNITKFHLSEDAVGVVTLLQGSAIGTELARLPIGESHARYLRIALWPTPSAAISYTLDFLRQVEDMTEPSDEPLVPQDFCWVLDAGARMLEYEKLDDRRWPAARAEFEKGVRDLKWFVTQQADGGSRPTGRPSQLGAWYPAGS